MALSWSAPQACPPLLTQWRYSQYIICPTLTSLPYCLLCYCSLGIETICAKRNPRGPGISTTYKSQDSLENHRVHKVPFPKLYKQPRLQVRSPNQLSSLHREPRGCSCVSCQLCWDGFLGMHPPLRHPCSWKSPR